MGFLDIFNRNKNKTRALPEPKVLDKQDKEDKEEKETIRVFSKKEGNNILYIIRMDSPEGSIPIGKFYKQTDNDNEREDITVNEAAKEIEEIIKQIKTAEKGEELTRAKQLAKAKLESISTKHMQFKLDKDIIEHIESYETEEDIDYNRLDKLVGSISDMSPSEIIKLGEQLSGRLDTLDSIKTPEDAYRDKSALVAYMKKKENIPENPVIDANIQSLEDGEKLDESTLIKIAQNMEQINNEDGVLYSAYLKLEEKRVLKQIMKVVQDYNLSINGSDMYEARRVNSSIMHIHEQINSIKGGFSSEILEYIIESIKEENIATYTKKFKTKDSELYGKVKNEFAIKEQDKAQILDFLSARIECLGQLYYKGDKRRIGKATLREFVENTNFKDPDNKESKEFLYIVAQIEKEHIKTQYIPKLNEYKRKENETYRKDISFKDRLHYEVEPGVISTTEKRIQNHVMQNRDEK